jgi:hypothetical protein
MFRESDSRSQDANTADSMIVLSRNSQRYHQAVAVTFTLPIDDFRLAFTKG